MIDSMKISKKIMANIEANPSTSNEEFFKALKLALYLRSEVGGEQAREILERSFRKIERVAFDEQELMLSRLTPEQDEFLKESFKEDKDLARMAFRINRRFAYYYSGCLDLEDVKILLSGEFWREKPRFMFGAVLHRVKGIEQNALRYACERFLNCNQLSWWYYDYEENFYEISPLGYSFWNHPEWEIVEKLFIQSLKASYCGKRSALPQGFWLCFESEEEAKEAYYLLYSRAMEKLISSPRITGICQKPFGWYCERLMCSAKKYQLESESDLIPIDAFKEAYEEFSREIC